MRALAWVCVAALAACASPNPHLYTLAVTPGPVAPGAPRTIEVRRIGLAGYLDRPGIVRSTSDYQLQIATDDRWGEPYGSLLLRVLDQDLTNRLPGSTVYSENGAISDDPDVILEIDIQRLDANPDNTVVLSAEISVRSGIDAARSTTRSVRLTTMPSGNSTPAYVAAESSLVGQLADTAADLLRGSGAQLRSPGVRSGSGS